MHKITGALIFVIRFYQIVISPYCGPCCRYYPTCSNYAIQALKKHGVFKGLYLACMRVIKCNPIGGKGVDYVP